MEIEFTVSGVNYRANKLDPFKQLHMVRKLGPVAPKIVPMIFAFKDLADAGRTKDIVAMVDASAPFLDVLASMPDADVEFIVTTALSVVKREQSGGWTPMVSGTTLMFSDLSLDQMIPIVIRSTRHSLGNFISGWLASGAGQPSTLEQTA